MSTESHGRRLDVQERRGRPSRHSAGDDYIAAVYEADRLRGQEKAAATAMVAFAQALAGIDTPPGAPPPVPALPEKPDETLPRTAAPGPRRRRPPPGHGEVLTWDEIMQLGWYDPLRGGFINSRGEVEE